MAFHCLNLTQETSTSTTGNYVLGGAVAGYRAFSSGLSNADVTVYTAYDSSGAFVSYFGVYNSGANSLTRGTVISSSNGGADISPWGAGTRNIVCGLPGETLQSLLSLQQAGSTGIVLLTSGSPLPTFTVDSVPLSLGNGGTNATTALTARIQLGLIIGTDVQAWDPDLDTIAGLSKTSGNIILANGSAWTSTALTASLVPYASAATPLTATDVEAALDQLAHPYARHSQTTTQDNIGTSIVALTDMDNLSIPGTGNSTKVYQVSGQVDFKNGTLDNTLVVSVHVGTNGTTSDSVIASSYEAIGNTSNYTVQIPRVTFVPTASEKVTISVTSAQNGNIDIGTATGDTFVVIRQISNA